MDSGWYNGCVVVEFLLDSNGISIRFCIRIFNNIGSNLNIIIIFIVIINVIVVVCFDAVVECVVVVVF